MPAPAPVTAHDTVQLIPATPKPKADARVAERAPAQPPHQRGDDRDAPRFDDALKQAQAKPRQADEAAPSRLARKVQKSERPQETEKLRSPRRQVEQAIESPPPPPEHSAEVAPDEAFPADARPTAELPAGEGAAAEPVALVSEPVIDSPDVAAVTLSPQASAPADVPVVPTNTAVPSPVESEEMTATTASNGHVARALVSDETSPPTVAGDIKPQQLAPDAVEAARVATGTEAVNPNAIEGQPESDVLRFGRAVQPAGQNTTTTGEPAAAVKVDAAPAPVEQVELSGEWSAGEDGSAPDDQSEASSPSLPGDSSERASAKAAAGAPASGGANSVTASATATATVPADVSDALAAAVKPAPFTPAEPSAPPAPAAPPSHPARELEFAQVNHDRLITAIRAQLLPRGGTMQIRLDPPELGSLQVAVRMLDGVMSVSFQTSTDEATQLLSHSLTQLKHVLESQGVAVDKLHVQQAQRSEPSSSNSNDEQQQHRHGAHGDENLARQEQQRREMLRRMWRRLALGSDPLDLVA